MRNINTKVVLAAVLIAYAVSWYLPILRGEDMLGYEGARLAMGTLESGIEYFWHGEDSDPDSVAEALLQIVAGSCNVLFIVTALLTFYRPVWGYVLAPFAVGSMLVWLFTDVGIGYYLWLFSGVSLFAYSVYMVRKQQRIASYDILVGAWSLPIYAAVLFIGGLYFALFLQEGA